MIYLFLAVLILVHWGWMAYSLRRVWMALDALRSAYGSDRSAALVAKAPPPRVRRSSARTQPTAPVTVDRSEQERLEILRRQTMPRNQNPLDDEEDDSLLVVPE